MTRPKNIMIADDDPGIVEAIELILEFSGYQVSSTNKGSNLLQLNDEQLPDLFLLDIWMSGEDGRDICRQLKADEVKKKVPVIMISASKDISASAFEAGADDFIAKPFEMDDLIKRIEQIVSIS